MQRVFITGGTGFIGKHLAARLADQGIQCRCLVRANSDTRHLERTNVELVRGAVDEPESYAEALRGCDTVVHLAGMTHAARREQLYRVNGEACGMLADACIAANVRRAVYVSSLAAAGPTPPGKASRDESDSEAPVSDYGRSKLAGEHEFRLRAASLPTTVLRPGVVYGPHDRNLAQMISAIMSMRIHMVVGFRTPALSLIHVDDLVELIILAAEKGETLSSDINDRGTGVYFACDDSEYVTYADFGRRIARSVERRVIVWPLFRWVGFSVGFASQSFNRLRGRSTVLNLDKIREATVRSWASSSRKAREQLGFVPRRSIDDYLPEVTRSYLQVAVGTARTP